MTAAKVSTRAVKAPPPLGILGASIGRLHYSDTIAIDYATLLAPAILGGKPLDQTQVAEMEKEEETAVAELEL